MRRPRLNVLRTFEAAGRRLSFSLAAKELNISQAAVSQQMRHLEAYLGEALFVRQHRSITLTGSGRAYLDTVHEALERLDAVTDQLFGKRPEQTVVIRCTSSVATLWLAPQIRAFQARHPDIELQIRTQEHEGETQKSDRTDLEIFVSGKPDHGPDVQPLLNAIITPVAAPGYLATLGPLSPSAVLKSDLIHILGYQDDWHSWFHTHMGQDVDIPRGLAVDSSLFAIDAALRGDGIFLGRRPFIDGHLKTGDLVEVFKQSHNLHATYYLRQPEASRNSRNRETVSQWLRDLAKDSKAEIPAE